jgi:UDP-N-acetylmuramoyl-tripeptide--D-alanyl-D-alanine ligase
MSNMENSIEHVYATFRESGRVITDSRETREGDIFIALAGEHHDGNHFADEALARGARLAVVNETGGKGAGRVAVPDTLRFLQLLARHHRRHLHVPLLAITGTNGKTTTKELCRAVLSRKYRVTATRGNLNNHIGVPLTLLEMDDATDVGIVEMGANHPGEIATACDLAAPTLGLITNIGRAHLEGFGSSENVVRAKNELYSYIRVHGGTLLVNGHDELLARLSRGIPSVVYGVEGAIARGKVTGQYPCLACDVETRAGRFPVSTRLAGGYNLDNVVAAFAAGLHLGVEPGEAREAIEAYTPSNARSQLVQGARDNTILLDAYNANPSSMRAAIAHFAGMPSDNKVLVLGEMLELGERTGDEHAGMLAWIAGTCPCRVLLVGRSFEGLKDNYTFTRWFPDTGALVEHLRREPVASSLVLVKGSRGNKLEQVVEYL